MAFGTGDDGTAAQPDWAIAEAEVKTIVSYLERHFQGGTVRVLTEPTDPGQLLQAVSREGTRHTLKLARAVLDDLRRHRIPLDQFLTKQAIARRLRGARRLVILCARGEDMFREERD